MPRTRMDELYELAENQDGLLLSKDARALGIRDSVLVRLAQRGRLERVNRGVYRVTNYPANRLAQYREAVLWAQAGHHSTERVALSYESALLIYGITDLNPSKVHLTVPKTARFRRKRPQWITIHPAELREDEITQREGIPITTIERTILDVLSTNNRIDVARQAVRDALREGLLNRSQATELRKIVNRIVPHGTSLPADQAGVHESKTH